MFKILYAMDSAVMTMEVKADSEGEAIERFDLMVDGMDDADHVEFISISECTDRIRSESYPNDSYALHN